MNLDYKRYGRSVARFRQARRLVLAASQGAGALWEFRWGNTTGAICLVERVTLKAAQIAAATAEELRFNLAIARTFTASDDTNSASILRANDMQKTNGDHSNSLLTAFRESNAATAPTGGTKTLDTDGIAQGSFVSILTAATAESGGGYTTVFDFAPNLAGEEVLRLEVNEGWVISLEATKAATAGVALYMETAWNEILPVSDT